MANEIANFISAIKGNADCQDENTKLIADFIEKYATDEIEEQFTKELEDLIINIM
ncbi:hypothetical protein DOK67_0000157 [Enterococcus sp. DIV0212c]|uniref:hypothetical protein n=1 Tax=Enterococcus sp. DIV0212c TaxID=2230867 RepID=UPI001A9B730B|nr:hypothetical protein [Enterococcus sp. DIV0212c]MBO1354006.1 hypothetical protein [Enterococcus sp. DIV0212c]